MKMNHNYLKSLLAPPPWRHLSEVNISEEGVDLHLPSSKEGAF